jgi:hypothetical protein
MRLFLLSIFVHNVRHTEWSLPASTLRIGDAGPNPTVLFCGSNGSSLDPSALTCIHLARAHALTHA